MRIQALFLALTLVGAQWVLYLLIALSIGSVAVMVDRWLHLRKRLASALVLRRESPALIRDGHSKDLDALFRKHNPGVGKVLAVALEAYPRGRTAFEGVLAAERSQEKEANEKYLAYLGTLGNNAPFIGLFGTVLGIIKAFHDLSISQEAGPSVVMGGIAEALVATAVGLMVAIPAVVAFNLFQQRSRRILAVIDEIGNLLVAQIPPPK
ncbi:MAG: MotA/TolQ/ExbB proton channel family protein [Nitrospirae bacterium]|nr:MotA/TolQ/ExbB proton channel family protein [Nitrospirota bacterium]